MAPNGLFITGTDTGVGKSLVAAGLIRHARAKGIRAIGLKPIETGCSEIDGELYPEDGDLLREASDKAVDLADCCPFRFRLPASPYRAALAEGKSLNFDDVISAVNRGMALCNFAIVEGAGGLMVPINRSEMMIDLPASLGLPAVLVARTRLGTINHTLLSVEALKRRSIPVAAVILSKSDETSGPEEESTPSDIAERLPDISVLSLPYLGAQSRDFAYVASVMEELWPEIEISKLLGITTE
jgi:dethiobiotin synthetase